jgi:HlyD family secretion protein
VKGERQKYWPVLCLLLAGCARQAEETPKPVVAVKVARAEVADLKLSVRAPATIFPREQANIAARITAPIRTLRVRKGDSVSAGQVLATLENRDILAQRAEAAAALVDAQASLQKISAGTLPTDVERARGQLVGAEAALDKAQKVYDRRAELFKQGAIPNRDLLVSQTELAQAKAAYDVAKKSLELLENQSRDKDIRIAESRVEQAKAKLAQTEAQLQFAELRSPFAGSITEQFLYPGDMAKPEAPAFTVMDLTVAIARAQVPEAQTGQVRIGQACSFASVDASSGPSGGRVIVVNKAVDPARRTVEVWCEIPNSGRRLRASVFGELTVATGVVTKAVVVPQSAVQFAEGTRKGSVLVVDQKHVAHKKDVEAGAVTEGKVQIEQGISPGESVIVEGGYGLPDGTEVRIVGNPK